MKFKEFIKDKVFFIIISIILFISIITLLFIFDINRPLIIMLSIFLIVYFIIIILQEYFRKKDFYNKIYSNNKVLDNKLLITEMIYNPNFLEGKIIYELLYEVNKYYLEQLNNIREKNIEFKEFIELWIHEIKLPLSTSLLAIHNDKNFKNKIVINSLKDIDNYLEQILYYERSEIAEKDLIIKKVKLNDVIKQVALRNKEDLLLNKIKLETNNTNVIVRTDSKFLEFIINQIISNSIKYKKEKNSYIKIYTNNKDKTIDLIIEDNGIGINESDLPRSFDKSFTGENGRIGEYSTGFGLFICKKLIDKLGHRIRIESEVNNYTKVIINFNNNSYYNVID